MSVGGSAGSGAAVEDALAYVFWHPPADGEPIADYEAALSRFHGALTDAPVAGLLATRAARVPELPWLPQGGYEDWYIVRDFGDLETLNNAAVDTARQLAHKDVSSRSGRGAGALYGLTVGTAGGVPAWATWLSKPRSVSYREFYETLRSHIESAEPSLQSGVGVWRRQLVLGPAPEFCVTSPVPLPALPPQWSAVDVLVESVFAS